MDRPLIMVITDSDTGMIVNMEILVKGFDIGIVYVLAAIWGHRILIY